MLRHPDERRAEAHVRSAIASLANQWQENSTALSDAFLAGEGSLQTTLIERALLAHLDLDGLSVLDVGGGPAVLAVALASRGCRVTVLDVDPHMLDAGRLRLENATPLLQGRIELRHGDACQGDGSEGGPRDLVTCHSVLMYENNLHAIVRPLVAAVRPGGMLSISSVNPESWAMRSGLQGNYDEVVDHLRNGTFGPGRFLPATRHSRSAVTKALAAYGATVLEWYGIGIFTDHLQGDIVVPDPARLVEAEWLAGARSPYRDVARCFHLVARREA